MLLCLVATAVCSAVDSGVTSGHLSLLACAEGRAELHRWVGLGTESGESKNTVCVPEDTDTVGRPKIFLFFAA